MSDLPAGLILQPFAVRVRQRAPGAENAIHTGYDVWGPLDFYFSDTRDLYLAGAVKGVINSVPTKHTTVFQSFSIVPTPIADRAAAARRHRERLLDAIRRQYKNAVVRAAAGGGRAAKRARHHLNRRLGEPSPSIETIERTFADRPDALAAAAEIKALWQTVAQAA